MKIPEKYRSVINIIGNILLLIIIVQFYISHPEYQQTIHIVIGIAILATIAFIVIFAPLTILMLIVAIFVYIHDKLNKK